MLAFPDVQDPKLRPHCPCIGDGPGFGNAIGHSSDIEHEAVDHPFDHAQLQVSSDPQEVFLRFFDDHEVHVP